MGINLKSIEFEINNKKKYIQLTCDKDIETLRSTLSTNWNRYNKYIKQIIYPYDSEKNSIWYSDYIKVNQVWQHNPYYISFKIIPEQLDKVYIAYTFNNKLEKSNLQDLILMAKTNGLVEHTTFVTLYAMGSFNNATVSLSEYTKLGRIVEELSITMQVNELIIPV